MDLLRASSQWATRPQDERYSDLESMYRVARSYGESAQVKAVPYSDLRVEGQGSEVVLIGKAGVPATFTNWAFGQVCARLQAPASYLRGLPASLSAQNLNYGFAHMEDREKEAHLLFHSNGGLMLRAATSDKYSRIWNYEVIERLQALPECWQPAPAAFDGSRGLYASDHDMFAFMVDNDRRIFEQASDGGLSRGFFVENSEVGSSSLRLTTFLYRFVCGNHIVWGAEDVSELAIRHVGSAHEAFSGKMVAELRKYSEASASDIEARIEVTMTKELGSNKEQVLDWIFGKRFLSRKQANDAYEETERHPEDGNPRTAWGIAQGVTRLSQSVPFGDKRTELDKAAGKILEAVF